MRVSWVEQRKSPYDRGVKSSRGSKPEACKRAEGDWGLVKLCCQPFYLQQSTGNVCLWLRFRDLDPLPPHLLWTRGREKTSISPHSKNKKEERVNQGGC